MSFTQSGSMADCEACGGHMQPGWELVIHPSRSSFVRGYPCNLLVVSSFQAGMLCTRVAASKCGWSFVINVRLIWDTHRHI